MDQTLPKIALITTGGTIGGEGTHRLDLAEYGAGMCSGQQLLDAIPEHQQFADVLVVDHGGIASNAIGPDDWLALARRIHDLTAVYQNLAGIVITHGTATLEETGYFLHLALKTTLPIVVVGAQRPTTGLSADGPMNLLGAIRVAISDAAVGLGVLVAMNEEIHCAREVTKSAVFRLHAFQAPEFGVLGHVDLDRVTVYRKPTRLHTVDTAFDVADITTLPRVDIVLSYAGGDGFAIDAAVAAGAKGIVITAFAPGVAPPGQVAAIERAATSGTLIVYTTRVAGGRIIAMPKYHVAGSVTADNLSPQKARVLLMLALTRSKEPQVIQNYFDSY